MKVPRSVSRVLLWQSAGYGLLALLSICNHFLDLPSQLGSAHGWRDGVMETAVVILIWAFAFSVTRRLLMRLRYLEGMLRVCAWCRKIGRGEKWMRMEAYFAEGFDVSSTHGICPECLKKAEEDTRQFLRKECASPDRAISTAGAAGESLPAT